MKVSVMVAMAALGVSLVGAGVSCGGDTGSDGGSGGGGGTGGKATGTGGKSGTGGTGGTGAGGAGGAPTPGAGGTSGGAPGGPPPRDPTAPAPPTDEQVFVLKFNEGTGATAMDSSANANHAALVEGTVRASPAVGAPMWVNGRDGDAGKAFQFDGKNDWARVEDSVTINKIADDQVTRGLSVTAWVKFDAFTADDNGGNMFSFVVCRQESARPPNEWFALGLLEGVPTITISHFFVKAPQPITLGEWTHIAMSYDGVTEKLYVNGAFINEYDAAVQIAPDDTPITIGAAENAGGVVKEHVKGTVDDIYMYSRPLTEGEIKSVMNAK